MVALTLFLILLCLGPALVTGYLAAQKNRSALGWFLFALFFGWIALILVIVLGPGQERRS